MGIMAGVGREFKRGQFLPMYLSRFVSDHDIIQKGPPPNPRSLVLINGYKI
jgi:hypothetical protein